MVRLPFLVASDLAGAVAAMGEVRARHGVAAVPTETFYGLAADPTDRKAVARIYRAKARFAGKALLVVGASVEQLESLVEIREPWLSRLRAVWPAPVTVVLPVYRATPEGGATLAVRVPAHEMLRRLLARVGPLTATSANVSGCPAALDPNEVERLFGPRLNLLLDGGKTRGGLPSTLIDCASPTPRLLRQGNWSPPVEWGVAGA